VILDRFRLDGQVALVTGAGTGMGQAIAFALAEAGADVAGVYRTHVDETRAGVEERGRAFLPKQIDLAQARPNDLRLLVEDVILLMGGLDVLVNCAGVIDRIPVLEFPEEVLDRTYQVNVKAVFVLTQAVAHHFVRQGHGKVINIGSVLSHQGGIAVPAYAASKSAVVSLTRSFANELAAKGVNVNCILPGFMATEFTQPLQQNPERVRMIMDRVPARRWGRAEDVQGAAVFLASSASDFVHGAALAVDGGWLGQ
jgi:2-dehydro-3-deoxy-D-gluconate 5-dehydrogenase